MSTDTPILMRDLDPSVRPREKAMRDGLDSLSDAAPGDIIGTVQETEVVSHGDCPGSRAFRFQ